MNSAGRPVNREVNNSYVAELMEHMEVTKISEFRKKTKLSSKTIDSWAYEGGSPLRSLEIALALVSATGKPLTELIEGFRNAEILDARALEDEAEAS